MAKKKEVPVEETAPDGPSENADSHTSTARITMTLPVQLTEQEMLRAGRDLAAAWRKLQSVEAEKKKVMDEFKAQISRAESDIGCATTLVQNGFRLEAVECDQVHDFLAFRVRTVRLDTGEIEKDRAMEEFERQQEMSFPKDEVTQYGELGETATNEEGEG